MESVLITSDGRGLLAAGQHTDHRFCLEAVQKALANYGAPEIVNTDQGCQFTSLEFTGLLKDHGVQTSMDGKGCWRDNVCVERLWKSITYEAVYLHAYETVSAAQCGLARYLTFYNQTAPGA